VPEQNGIKKGSLKETMLLAIPSFFDLIATILMNIGLLSVTASVYQMMRGAEMLFAALFAVTFLKRHLNKYHYLGILCCGVSDWGKAFRQHWGVDTHSMCGGMRQD
jgi:drug/metabolite transporter (DMT)-like permease